MQRCCSASQKGIPKLAHMLKVALHKTTISLAMRNKVTEFSQRRVRSRVVASDDQKAEYVVLVERARSNSIVDSRDDCSFLLVHSVCLTDLRLSCKQLGGRASRPLTGMMRAGRAHINAIL